MQRKTCRLCEKDKAISMFFSFKDSVKTLSACKGCCKRNQENLLVDEFNFVTLLFAEQRRLKNRRREINFKNKYGFSRKGKRKKYKYKPVNADGVKKKCLICNKNKDTSLFFTLSETEKATCCKMCVRKPINSDIVPIREIDAYKEDLMRIKRKARKNKKRKPSTFVRCGKKLGFVLKDGYSLHHWSYEFKYSWDVFVIENTEHQNAHLLMKREKDENFYRTLAGEALDTKEKHFDYLNQRGVILEHCEKSKVRVNDKPWCRGKLSIMEKFQSKMWL